MSAFKDPQTKYWEDFSLGDTIVTRGRTIDIGDITSFAGLTGDHYPLHTDEEYARETRFGTRIAHGPLVFAIAVGLVGMTGFYGDAIIALVEIRELRALLPVKPGDTLRVRAMVADLTTASKPKYGQLSVEYRVENQTGDIVMTFTQVMLANRRGDERA